MKTNKELRLQYEIKTLEKIRDVFENAPDFREFDIRVSGGVTRMPSIEYTILETIHLDEKEEGKGND